MDIWDLNCYLTKENIKFLRSRKIMSLKGEPMLFGFKIKTELKGKIINADTSSWSQYCIIREFIDTDLKNKKPAKLVFTSNDIIEIMRNHKKEFTYESEGMTYKWTYYLEEQDICDRIVLLDKHTLND